MSKSDDRKKLRERSVLDAFRQAFGGFPEGSISQQEEPDFIVESPIGSIGIELTEYFRQAKIAGSYLQEQEALRFTIVRTATGEALKAKLGGIFAVVFFTPENRIVKRDVTPAVGAIVTQLQRFTEATPYQKVINEGQFPPFIECVIVYFPEGEQTPSVTTADASFVPKIGNDELQAIVTAKQRKVERYRASCRRVWLLIEVNGFKMSSMGQLPDPLASVTTTFDRVFVLQNGRMVVEVPVTAG
jgi:hypothetical protein